MRRNKVFNRHESVSAVCEIAWNVAGRAEVELAAVEVHAVWKVAAECSECAKDDCS